MENGQIRLLCLPYAGANIYSYKVLEPEFPNNIVMYPFELPGRGKRFGQPLIDTVEEAVEDLWKQIKSQIEPPYAIFGHSMGAVLGYLIIQRILAEKLALPVHFFCSARSELWKAFPNSWHKLPSEPFWKKIQEIGGLPAPYLDSTEMKEIFEPILRADFKIVEVAERNPVKIPAPIDVPITVFLGREDLIIEKQIAWQRMSAQKVAEHYFPGGHFYFLQHGKALANLIVDILLTDVNSTTANRSDRSFN